MFDFPEIPESLEGVSSSALRDLINSLRTAASAVATARAAGEDVPEDAWDAALAAPPVLASLREARAAALTAEAAEAALLQEGLGEDDDPPADPPAGEDDDPADPPAGEDDDPADPPADPPAPDAGDTTPPAPTSAAALQETAPGSQQRPAGGGAGEPSRFTFLNGVKGRDPGDEVTDMVALAEAMEARYRDIRGGSAEKIGVAQIQAKQGALEDHEPMVGFTPGDLDVITAGLTCVPRENLYDVGCTSSTERPFANSLPNRRPARGGYSVYPSPKLADVTDRADEVTGEGDPEDNGNGIGQWTREDDGDLQAVKEACAQIPCGDPEDFDIWGVYRCITVRNLLQLTFPELVAAYLNKLQALWARFAETLLMDGMLSSPWSTDISRDVSPLNLGATGSLLDTLVQTAMLYTESERFGDGQRWGIWLHRWVATLLIRDWMKAPRYNPSMSDLIAARSEINAAFNKAGFNPHWVIDSPTRWSEPDRQGEGDLEGLPTYVGMKIAPEGNFGRLDLGNMTVGVTNRNPWDKDDMARNQFTMFWESYEGIIDYGCESYNLDVGELCINGGITYELPEAPTCVASNTGG